MWGAKEDADGSSILLVMAWPPSAPGGVTSVVLNLYKELFTRPEIRPILISDSWDDKKIRKSNCAGIPTIFRRIPSPGAISSLRGLKQLLAFFFSILFRSFDLKRMILAERVELINLHFPGSEALFWVLLKKVFFRRVKLVLSFHGADVTELKSQLKAPFGRLIWRVIADGVTAITACSAELAEEIRTALPGHLERICVLPNGVDSKAIIEEASNFVPSIIDSIEGPYFIFIGGFEQKKGLDFLLRSYALARNRGLASRLVIVSRDGPARLEITSLAEELGLRKSVSFRINAPHAEVMGLLSKSVGLVVPSRREPFGLVALEAAVLGVPILITEICGVLSVIKDCAGISAIPVDDEYALVKGMLEFEVRKSRYGNSEKELGDYVSCNLTWAVATDTLLKFR